MVAMRPMTKRPAAVPAISTYLNAAAIVVIISKKTVNPNITASF